jgi:translocation and assembly module TamB
LPRLVLPLALDIHSLELNDVRLRKQKSEWPVARIAAKGYWHGAAVRIDHLQAQEPRYGTLALTGKVKLLGGYPVQARGQLSPRWLAEKGWTPLQVSLAGEVARLDINAVSQGRYPATLTANVRPLLPNTPYRATLDWSDLSFPWFTEHELRSDEGQLKVIGDRYGLRSQGRMALHTKYTPIVASQWQLDMDWKKINFESLIIKGLGGEVKAKGEIGWSESGLRWSVSSLVSKIDLARHWAIPHTVVPVLGGTLTSKGHSSKQGSSVEAVVKLNGGESWTVADNAKGLLWLPQTRHDAVVDWSAVRRPAPGVQFVQSDHGHLAFKGNRDTYVADFLIGMTTGLMPRGVWQGQVHGTTTHLDINTLSYKGEAGALQAGGELDFGNALSWRGALLLDEFSSAQLMPNWSGQFSGSVSGQGVWKRHEHDINLGDVNITGTLRNQPLRLDGPIRLQWHDGAWPRLASPAFNADWGGNVVALEGSLQEQWDATIAVDLAHPELILPGMQGRIQGRADVSGPERTPDVLLDVTMEQGAYAGHGAQSARLQATLPGLGTAQGDASLVLSGMTIKNGVAIGDLSLSARGVLSEHQLTWQFQGNPASMSGQLAGGWDHATGNWWGNLHQGQISIGEWQWLLSSETPLSWEPASRTFLLGDHCWSSETASLCADEPVIVGPSGSVVLSLRDFQTERLAPFMPDGMTWMGTVAGEAKAEWQPGQAPTAKTFLRAGAGEFRLVQDEAGPLFLRYDQLEMTLDADAAVVNSHLAIVSNDLGNARLDASINPFVEGKPVTGEVAVNGMRLELLRPFLPALSQLTGQISAEGRLDGPLLHPRYWGNLQLKEGTLALRNAPLAVDDMSLWVDVQGDKAEFSGQLQSGEGEATLSGRGEWADSPRVALDLKGNRFAIRQEPEILAELSPDLHIGLQPGQVELTGSVAVPYARVNLKKLPERTVGVSSDVRVVETADGNLRASVTKRGQAMAIKADVELVLGNDVVFNGFGVMGALNGGVHLRQSDQRGLEAYGELGLDKEARYEAYGQKLKIRNGRLVFAGNISQPAINAEAIKEVDDKVVGIRVAGRANAPEATLFSEPTMSQADMLSYLVLGRPLAQRAADGTNTGNDAMLAAAAIKLGAKGGAGLTSGLGSLLGVRDLSVDAEGSGDDTQVKVSGYVSPDLFLSYGVGVFTPVNTVTMRYQIRPRLYLEAVSSLENAIDLFYNFRF